MHDVYWIAREWWHVNNFRYCIYHCYLNLFTLKGEKGRERDWERERERERCVAAEGRGMKSMRLSRERERERERERGVDAVTLKCERVGECDTKCVRERERKRERECVREAENCRH